MTGWTGVIYLVDQQARDHIAEVTLPGPLSLSREQIGGLELPDGFQLQGVGALTPVTGPTSGQAILGEVRPKISQDLLPALTIDEFAFESPPRMSENLPCPALLEQALLPAGGNTRLYLLFDAGRLMPLLRVFDPGDLISDRRGAALFLSDGMARQSPWLVDVTPDEDGSVSRLLRQFLRSAWNQRAGIFLRSSAGFDELFRFLRSFTRVDSGAEEKKTTLLRYWDPLVSQHWFVAQGQDQARVSRLFWLPSGARLEIIGETGATGFFRLSPTAVAPETKGRKGLLTLGDIDHQALRHVAMVSLGRELSTWVMAARPDRFADFTHRKVARLEAHVLQVGQQYNLRRKEDFAALLNAMVQLGGWFHLGGTAPELVEILTKNETGAGESLTETLSRIAPQSLQGRIAARWEAISSYLAGIPPDARLESDAFRNMVATISAADDPRIVGAIQTTLRDISKYGLSRNETGIVLALTLIYGHRYYNDPLRDWALVMDADKEELISLSSRLWPRVPADM